jgi:hypothetical protein
MVLFHVNIQFDLKVSSFQKETKTIIGGLIKDLTQNYRRRHFVAYE